MYNIGDFHEPFTTFASVLCQLNNSRLWLEFVYADTITNFLILAFLRIFLAFSKVSAFSTKVENADMRKGFSYLRVRCPQSACLRFPPSHL